MTAPAAAQRCIFISASHQDSAFVRRLVRDLRRMLGASAVVRYDLQGSKKGGDAAWRRALDDLTACPVFIAVLSPDAIASKWVNDQIDVAWQQQNTHEGKFIVPVMCRPCTVREDLDTRQIVSFVPPTRYEDAFRELLRALGLSTATRAVTPSPVTPSSTGTGRVSVKLGRRELFIGAGVAGAAALGGLGLLYGPRIAASFARGTRLWRAPTKPSQGSGLLVVGDTLYVGSTEGVLRVVDAASGVIRASYQVVLRGSVTRPALASGVLYVGASTFQNDGVFALDAASGNAGPWTSYPIGSGGNVTSAPVVAGGAVYIGSEDTYLYAVSAADGSLLWRQKTGGAITASAVVDGSTVYIASADHSVHAFDAAHQGASLHQFDTGDAIKSAPALSIGMVYVASHDATLYAFDIASGTTRWRLATGGALDGSPVVAGGLVYVCSADGSLYAADAASGTRTWTHRTGGPISSTPAVAGSSVYVGTDDGTIYALDAASGTPIWKYVIGAPVRSPLAVADSRVYVNAEDGSTYALSA